MGYIFRRYARTWLDLDQVGAPIGELEDRSQTGADMTQIGNGETGER